MKENQHLPCHSLASALFFSSTKMNSFRTFLLGCIGIAVTMTARAEHPFLCTDSYAGKVCVVSREGKIEWEYACKHPQDCWRLASGNYLFCHAGGVLEVTSEKKIVWE